MASSLRGRVLRLHCRHGIPPPLVRTLDEVVLHESEQTPAHQRQVEYMEGLEAGERRAGSCELLQPLSSVSQAPFELQLAAVLGGVQHRKTCRTFVRCGDVPPTCTAAAGSSSKYPVPKGKTTILRRSHHEARATLRASRGMTGQFSILGFPSSGCPLRKMAAEGEAVVQIVVHAEMHFPSCSNGTRLRSTQLVRVLHKVSVRKNTSSIAPPFPAEPAQV
jgi:hypothetical protein